MRTLGIIAGWIIGKLIQIIIYIWLIAALIPIFIGIFLMDALLKVFKVEKYYLLFTDFMAWLGMISEHLKHLKTKKKKEDTGEQTNYV